LSALTSYRHQIQAGDIAVILDSLQELFREKRGFCCLMNSEKEDIPVMFDCLQELFNEYGDAVIPTLLVERIERKLHRHISMHIVAHQYTSLGFVTKRLNAKQKYSIIPNPELLAESQ
jgi:hypothetical protein